jgi:hypothetical protein
VRDARRSNDGRGQALWLVGLGACTLWLAMQNTLLVLAALWIETGTTRTLVAALVKAGALVITGFWSSPAGLVLAVTLAMVVAFWSSLAVARGEARHG